MAKRCGAYGLEVVTLSRCRRTLTLTGSYHPEVVPVPSRRKCFPSRCTRVLGTSCLRCGSGRRGDYHAKVAILGTADGRLSPFLRMVSGPVASAPSGLLPGSCHTEVAPSGCRRIPDASVPPHGKWSPIEMRMHPRRYLVPTMQKLFPLKMQAHPRRLLVPVYWKWPPGSNYAEVVPRSYH